MRLPLHEYALRLAEAAAQRSEDPKRQVGACLLREDGTVAALGYNGTPSGVLSDKRLWESPAKDLYVIHAEVNALRYVRPGEAVLLASTYRPCVECVKTAAAQGVRKIVYRQAPTALEELWPSQAAADAFGVLLVQVEGSGE